MTPDLLPVDDGAVVLPRGSLRDLLLREWYAREQRVRVEEGLLNSAILQTLLLPMEAKEKEQRLDRLVRSLEAAASHGIFTPEYLRERLEEAHQAQAKELREEQTMRDADTLTTPEFLRKFFAPTDKGVTPSEATRKALAKAQETIDGALQLLKGTVQKRSTNG